VRRSLQVKEWPLVERVSLFDAFGTEGISGEQRARIRLKA
jgi:hypothetical protein